MAHLPVVVPLDARRLPAEALADFVDLPYPCLLHGAAAGHAISRYSFLSADPVEVITTDASNWPWVCRRIRPTIAGARQRIPELPPFQGGWMGWLGYELGTAFDRTIRHPNQPVPVADVALSLYDWVIAWDHAAERTWLISSGVNAAGHFDAQRAERRAAAIQQRWHMATRKETTPQAAIPSTAPESDFTADSYQAAVDRVIEYVLAGDIFQANLAQRFTAPFTGDALRLYHAMLRHSAAPMAAFVRHGDTTVVSASPERFVNFDAATRRVETRPIKGTRPRSANRSDDAMLADALLASEKDRAENVMIVDLLRNDLSRVCVPGSVRTPVLCALETHPTVHHLVSTVEGVLRPGCDALDLLAGTFPGGSITGAPKLRAMEIIRELEPVARGVYSGAIGWLGLDGSLDTSIAIRTMVVAEGLVTMHAGGGITARSSAAEEYRESLTKAQAMIAAVTTPG